MTFDPPPTRPGLAPKPAWTDARKALLAILWLTDMMPADILTRLNELPGTPIPFPGRVGVMANSLGLKRSPDFKRTLGKKIYEAGQRR